MDYFNTLLKSVAFPSRTFPGADLCLSPGTEYDFNCLSCQADVSVALDWGFRPQQHSGGLSRQEQNAVIDYFARSRKVSRTEEYERVKCLNCGTEYILALQFEEVSWGASRVAVTDVAQVEPE